MAAYELTGTVKVVMEVVKFDSGFTKREFVVTTGDDRYPQAIKFECVKDRCALLDKINPGQRVTVSFDLRGNEYKGRYFVSLSAWKVIAEDRSPGSDFPDEGPPVDQRAQPNLDEPVTPF
jgi:single-strand DNA-binding protein